MRSVLLPKRIGETLSYQFDFSSLLASGETLTSAATTVSVYSGVDPSPSGIVSGSATISGGVVTQLLTGGVLGVLYIVKVQAASSLSQVLDLEGILAILPEMV